MNTVIYNKTIELLNQIKSIHFERGYDDNNVNIQIDNYCATILDHNTKTKYTICMDENYDDDVATVIMETI